LAIEVAVYRRIVSILAAAAKTTSKTGRPRSTPPKATMQEEKVAKKRLRDGADAE
jgi:hypothetical protein